METAPTIFYVQDTLLATLLENHFTISEKENVNVFSNIQSLDLHLTSSPVKVLIFDIGYNIRETKEYLVHFKKKYPDVSIILFDTMFLKSEALHLCFELNASGFLHKGCNLNHIEEGIKSTLSGITYYSPYLQHYLQNNTFSSTSLVLDKYNLSSLTKQEKVILKKVAEGATEKAIAIELFVSLSTVKIHKNNIAIKLGIKGKEKLSYVAYQVKDIIL